MVKQQFRDPLYLINNGWFFQTSDETYGILFGGGQLPEVVQTHVGDASSLGANHFDKGGLADLPRSPYEKNGGIRQCFKDSWGDFSPIHVDILP